MLGKWGERRRGKRERDRSPLSLVLVPNSLHLLLLSVDVCQSVRYWHVCWVNVEILSC